MLFRSSIYWTPKIWPFEKKQNYFFDNGEGGISAGDPESNKSNFVFAKNGVITDLDDTSKKNAVLFFLDSLAQLNKKLKKSSGTNVSKLSILAAY